MKRKYGGEIPIKFTCVLCEQEFIASDETVPSLHSYYVDDPERSWCKDCYDKEEELQRQSVTYERADSPDVTSLAPGLAGILGSGAEQVPIHHRIPRYILPKSEWNQWGY